jgi:hypothetical protein
MPRRLLLKPTVFAKIIQSLVLLRNKQRQSMP